MSPLDRQDAVDGSGFEADPDIEIEPVRGLPEAPPEGERILWQGRPAWMGLAWRAFGVRLVALYLVVAGGYRASVMAAEGATAGEIVLGVAGIAVMAAAGAAILALMAFVTARTTVYTITTRRVAMRIGAALNITINLPFRWIGAAAVRHRAGGTADLPLTLIGESKLAYLMLWPHVRPWKMGRPEPMLRNVPNGAAVATVLAEALRTHQAIDPTLEPAPSPAPGSVPAGVVPAGAGLVPAE